MSGWCDTAQREAEVLVPPVTLGPEVFILKPGQLVNDYNLLFIQK